MLSLLLLSLVWVPGASAQALSAAHDKHYIIGGQPIAKTDYPWVVALARNENNDLFQRQFCGATVIADTWALTAAHCLFNQRGGVITTSEFTVAINAANLDDPDARELLVTNFYIHPEYNHSANNPHSDLALLELATPSGIDPITLSTKASSELTGLLGTAIGWGATDVSDPESPLFPSWSHKVDVPIVSLDVCNGPNSYENAIYENQLCAGYAAGGRDSCVGDSGGPLVVNYQGQLQQVGVVSFGFGCAQPNYYGIYTDVPYFIGWINQYVYVGEPEFEPELIVPRVTTPATGNTAVTGTPSNTQLGTQSSTGSSSLIGILLLGVGLLLRRRS